MNDYIELTYGQVALATALILVNAAISLGLQLRLERSLLWAGLRTIVQLTLVGLVLEWVFELNRWYLVLALLVFMTTVAGVTAVQNTRRRYRGIWWNTLLSVWASSWLVTLYGVMVIWGGVGHWANPQYTIPLLGMVLGNTLNGITLGLNGITDALRSHRGEVETLLALGASRWESARRLLQGAVRSGMIPIINSMMVVGLVSLPGMMTGQLISGTSPLEAVKYQIVIMFLIASATALGAVGVVILTFYSLFNRRHQFLAESLRDLPNSGH